MLANLQNRSRAPHQGQVFAENFGLFHIDSRRDMDRVTERDRIDGDLNGWVICLVFQSLITGGRQSLVGLCLAIW